MSASDRCPVDVVTLVCCTLFAWIGYTEVTLGQVASTTRRAELEQRQARVQRHMEELEDRMFQLAEAVREGAPDHAARLVLGLERSREELLVEEMKRAAEAIAADRYDEAEELQRQILFRLGELRELLLSTDLDLLLKLERLRQLNRIIGRLSVARGRAASLVEQAAKIVDDDETTLLPGLALAQSELRASLDVLRGDVDALLGSHHAARQAGQAAVADTATAADAFAAGRRDQGVAAGRAGLAAMDRVQTELQRAREDLLFALQAFIRRYLIEAVSQMHGAQQRVSVDIGRAVERAKDGREIPERWLTEIDDRQFDVATRASDAIQLIEETEYSVSFPVLLAFLREQAEGGRADVARGAVATSLHQASLRLEGDLAGALAILIEEAKWAKRADPEDRENLKLIRLMTELLLLRQVQDRLLADTRSADSGSGAASDGITKARVLRLAEWQEATKRAMEALVKRGDSELLARLLAAQEEDV